MRSSRRIACIMAYAGMLALCKGADIPEQINYQARVEESGVPFDGTGKFKFAIVDQAGSNTFWSNDGTSAAGNEPAAAVDLNVVGGLLNVMLGNASYPNMMPILASALEQPDRLLRVWFGGAAGSSYERLVPDTPLGSTPFAYLAASVPDSSLSGEKLALGSVWPAHEGRDRSIKSYHAEFNREDFVDLAFVPTNMCFVITDITANNVYPGYWQYDFDVRYTLNTSDTVLVKVKVNPSGGYDDLPTIMNFRSGLVVPGGAELKVGGFVPYPPFAGDISVTIAGYECEQSPIVSYFLEFTGSNLTTVATIPTNKIYVITDVIANNVNPAYRSFDYEIRYYTNVADVVLLKHKVQYYSDTHDRPAVHHFKSGLSVPAGAQLKIGGWVPSGTFQGTKAVMVSGFEIPAGVP